MSPARKSLAALLLRAFAALFLTVSTAAAQPVLSEADRAAAGAYFEAAEREAWDEARRQIEATGAPLLRKGLWWHFLIQRESGAGFEAIARFARDNPDWPAQVTLAIRADEAATFSDDPALTAAWFAENEPRSHNGWSAYISALTRLGREAEAAAVVRRVWRGVVLENREADDFLNRHRRILDDEDHRERMRLLLREREVAEARHLLSQVTFDDAAKSLYELRLSFMKRSGANEIARIQAALDALPETVKAEPDMLYDRIRWHRVHDQDQTARNLLLTVPPIDPPRRRWWIERSIQIRASLEDGDFRMAYGLASGHRQTDPNEAEQAEALAGWVALRFLEGTEAAAQHFERALSIAPDAPRRARNHYWLGRTAQMARRAREARRHYREAAAHPGTYYGQMAQRALGHDELVLPEDAVLPDSARDTFDGTEVAQAARLFMALDRPREVRIFLARRIFDASNPQSYLYTGLMGERAGLVEFQVWAARGLVTEGYGFLRAGYPQLPLNGLPDAVAPVERALIFAIIRQESSFNPEAGSWAGARGLMQLMPATARSQARRLRVRYSHGRLTSDPEYNILLGSYFLSRMLERYEGSYVLAAAAYNAGPRNADSWIERLGDPRDADTDIVDWIERIPFGETREYVRRVLANLTVYRALEGEPLGDGNLHRAWRSEHFRDCARASNC